jgi:two-component system catabolic regulation response regulator CreB
MKPRILIVEDEPGIADTLQYALRTEGFEPVWVSTGADALAQVRQQLPALVILDVGLPDTSGFEVFKRLREWSDLPVVFLTARSDEIDRVVGLELGADDYVAKPFSPRELVARVRTVLRRVAKAPASAPAMTALAASAAALAGGVTGGNPVASNSAGNADGNPRVASRAHAPSTSPFTVDEGRRQIRFYGRALELSRYEFGLLQTLASRPGHVYSRDALLQRVWGDGTESMDRTVDAHVKTLRAKMKLVAPLLEPIRTHRGSGYCLAEDLPADLAG